MNHRERIVYGAILLLAVWGSCQPSFKSGEILCSNATPRCPEGFSCVTRVEGEFCYAVGETPGVAGRGGTAGNMAGMGGNGGANGGGMIAGGRDGSGTAGIDGGAGAGGNAGGAGGNPGGCGPAQISCPAVNDDPMLCVSPPGTCASAVRCGGTTYACAAATELVDCSQSGRCLPLGMTCDVRKVEALEAAEAEKRCVRCIFRKCCGRLVNCLAVGCVELKMGPEYDAYLACTNQYCGGVCPKE